MGLIRGTKNTTLPYLSFFSSLELCLTMAGLEPVGESRSKMAAMSLILLCCPVLPLVAALAADEASLGSSLCLFDIFMLVFVGD